MGQDHSSLVDDDTPPEALSDRTLAAVAKYIKDGKAQKIVAMTGAGISTAAGSASSPPMSFATARPQVQPLTFSR